MPAASPSSPPAAVFRETFEACADAWLDNRGNEPAFASDPAWAICSPGSGGRVQSLQGEARSIQSPWFTLIPLQAGQTYCLSAAVRWLSGPRPVIGLQRYSGAKVPLGIDRVTGPALDGAATKGSWRRYRGTYVAPTGTAFGQIDIGFSSSDPAAPVSSYVDDVAVYAGACS
jgi:hypothetical protein